MYGQAPWLNKRGKKQQPQTLARVHPAGAVAFTLLRAAEMGRDSLQSEVLAEEPCSCSGKSRT